jgi:hypothetical protein
MAGLTAGLAVGILILLWVNVERSFNEGIDNLTNAKRTAGRP